MPMNQYGVDESWIAARSETLHRMALAIQEATKQEYLACALQAEMAYLKAERNPRPVAPVVPASVARTTATPPPPARTGTAHFGAGDRGRPKDGDQVTVYGIGGGGRAELIRRRS